MLSLASNLSNDQYKDDVVMMKRVVLFEHRWPCMKIGGFPTGVATLMSRNSEAKRNEQILTELLKDEANRQCADCRQKGIISQKLPIAYPCIGTRWASWNIGVFLCIRCGGLHRKLGTHISKVKSVTLDSWTDEEIQVFRSSTLPLLD